MWKFVVVYTLIVSLHPVKMRRFGEYYSTYKEAERGYQNLQDECTCDSAQWRYITRKEIRDNMGVIGSMMKGGLFTYQRLKNDKY